VEVTGPSVRKPLFGPIASFARSSFDHLVGAGERQSRTKVAILSWNLAGGARVPGRDTWWRSTGSQTYGREQWTVLATRSALNGSNRPVPRAEPLPKETVVRSSRCAGPCGVRFGESGSADSEHVLLLFEPRSLIR